MLGVLVDIIMPEGDTSKYIKGIFALITVFIIVYPLPSLLRRDFSFDFSNIGQPDSAFVSNVNAQNARVIEQGVERVLRDNNFSVAFVAVNLEPFESEFRIQSLNIFLLPVINGQAAHIIDKEAVIRLTRSVVNIQRERIHIFA